MVHMSINLPINTIIHSVLVHEMRQAVFIGRMFVHFRGEAFSDAGCDIYKTNNINSIYW